MDALGFTPRKGLRLMMFHALPWWMPLSVFVWIVLMIAFHGLGYAFEYCDRTRTLRRFKVRDIDRKTYRQLMPQVVANQVFILLPCMMAMQVVGLAFAGAPHVPLWRYPIYMVVLGLAHDIVQYVTHRYLLHRPSLIRTLKHSIHHSTGASKGISACYMSGPDFFLEIVLPYLIPLALIGGGGSDIVFQSLMAGLGAFGGVYEHSGYDFSVLLPKTKIAERMPRFVATFAGLISSHAHGEHHAKGNVSFSDGFGSTSLCDTALGTRWDLVEARQRTAAAATPAE